MITRVRVGKQESELDKAIKILKRYYGIATGAEGIVKKPIAWALYQTWQEVNNGKRRD